MFQLKQGGRRKGGRFTFFCLSFSSFCYCALVTVAALMVSRYIKHALPWGHFKNYLRTSILSIFLYLRCSFSGYVYMTGFLISFRSLFRYHLLKEAFLDQPFYLFIYLFLTSLFKVALLVTPVPSFYYVLYSPVTVTYLLFIVILTH